MGVVNYIALVFGLSGFILSLIFGTRLSKLQQAAGDCLDFYE